MNFSIFASARTSAHDLGDLNVIEKNEIDKSQL